ncbi:hypothetical protein ERJ75_000684000 [Trypanosoma vivax]|nr:hypothetical protein ERJ75_000684000 [Trypanosoma vivax]
MLHRSRGRATGKCAHNAARHMTGTATEARGGTEEGSSHAMVWPQCPTRRTAVGERQRGARQQIARGKWNAKARGKDVRGRGDLGVTIEGGATRAGRSQAAAERRRNVVEKRETRGCARGMLTMTAMSRVGKVAVRARSRAAEARCEDVLAGERAVMGKLAQSARRVSWCATAIAAQKQWEKQQSQGGDAGTHGVARPRKQAHVRAKRSVVALHRQRLPWPGRLAGTQGTRERACFHRKMRRWGRQRCAKGGRGRVGFAGAVKGKGRGVRARRRGERCRRLELLR